MPLSVLRIMAMACCAAAGFSVAWFWPVGERNTPAVEALRVATEPDREPWRSLQGAERVAAFKDHSTGIGAAEWPEVFTRHRDDELLRDTLLDEWIAADPAGLWQWIVRQKDAGLLAEVGPRLFGVWAQRDAAAAFAATAHITSPRLRDPLRTLVVETELARDLDAGLALAARFGPLSGTSSIRVAWIERDPAAALIGLTALSGGQNSFRNYYLRAAAAIAARKEPHAFVEWLETKPHLGEHSLRSDIFKKAQGVDPVRAIAALEAIPPGPGRNDGLSYALAAATAQLSAADVIQSAHQHLQNWQRNRAIAEAAEAAAEHNPTKAAELFAAVPASQYAIHAARKFAQSFAQADWTAARNWVESLPDAPSRRAAWPAIGGNVPLEYVGDLAAAAATMPADDLSDYFLAAVRKALAAADSAAEEQWLNSLPADRADWARAVKRE